MSTVIGEFQIVHCAKCSHEWALGRLPMAIDVFVKVARRPCPACGGRKARMGPLPRPTAAGDYRAWRTNGDTSASSETIWSVLSGEPVPRTDIPYDPADFGRCYRLLQAMPAWRARLPEVADAYPAWTPFVEAWDELTATYEAELPTGRCPRLYARMRQLRGQTTED